MPAGLITDTAFYVAACCGMLIFGISKAGFAGSAGFVAFPIIASQAPPGQTAAIMLPILCVMDLLALWVYRSAYDLKNLRILLPPAVLGIALGGLSFSIISPPLIKLMVAGLAIFFFVSNVRKKSILKIPFKHSYIKGTWYGLLMGFKSTLIHAGGIPFQLYVLPQRLDKTTYIGTSVIAFAVVNYTKIIPYALLGELSTTNLLTSLILLPIAPVGIFLGYRLHHRISEKNFYFLLYTLLLFAVAKLLYDGFLALL